MSNTVLIIDDDEAVALSLALVFKQAGMQSLSAKDPEQAMQILAQHPIDCIVQDMNFSLTTTGEEGLLLLQRIKAYRANVPVILITAWATIDLAVQGVKLGAADFISKPWNNQQLLQSVQTAIELNSKCARSLPTITSRADLSQTFDFSDIVGESPQLLQILQTISRVCKTDASVLILGESGTGKELIAEAIHKNSKRSQQPLIKVNLGGINSSLFDSEMFGHQRGAFTDAKSDRQGRFQAAEGGTLFLDEIGDLDKASQVKMLRVLQDKSFQSIGSSETRHANVRVISATNHDLQQRVSEGLFREDLLYRINLITIKLPPLRARKQDIVLIARHLLQKIAAEYSINELQLTSSAIQWLKQQSWPGNIRQLKQTIERTVLVADAKQLQAQHFELAADITDTDISKQQAVIPSGLTLDQIEKQAIIAALENHSGNVSLAADELGLTRQSLYRRMQKHGVKD